MEWLRKMMAKSEFHTDIKHVTADGERGHQNLNINTIKELAVDHVTTLCNN